MDQITGIVTAPQMALRIGQNFSIEELLLKPWPEDGLKVVGSLAAFRGALLTLGAFGGGASYTYGSAVLIAPGIAVAAGHVIHEHRSDGLFKGDFAMYAFGIAEQGMTAWQVTEYAHSEVGDIAVLTLAYSCELPIEMTIAHYAVSARLPVIGERITAIGFRPREGKRVIEPGNHLPDLHGSFLMSSGPVLEVWGGGRDSVMAPRPCFAAGLATVGAMSGGAVLDSTGHLIGIVTSSNDDGSAPYTMVTMVWDALTTQIDPVWPPKYWHGPDFLMNLIKPVDGWRLTWSEPDERWWYQTGDKGPTGV